VTATSATTPLRCPKHPEAAVRRFLADGELGRGLYAFCIPAGGAMHPLGPVPDEPPAETGDRLPHLGRPGLRPGRSERDRLFDSLSPPELDVLAAAARGLTVSETAHELQKSPQTVKSQRNAVILKLGARNMTHAVCMAAERGLVGAR
jgi:DNA-binding CsgD family transcriptional regulator